MAAPDELIAICETFDVAGVLEYGASTAAVAPSIWAMSVSCIGSDVLLYWLVICASVAVAKWVLA
ncbi:MAG TPA: hypothetical protein DEH75_19115, partial [Bradyrhizobium sp.]|nr:hypothetical protein [Bradyrhizobium sp.]